MMYNRLDSEQKIRYEIGLAYLSCKSPEWIKWAEGCINNTDRSIESAILLFAEADSWADLDEGERSLIAAEEGLHLYYEDPDGEITWEPDATAWMAAGIRIASYAKCEWETHWSLLEQEAGHSGSEWDALEEDDSRAEREGSAASKHDASGYAKLDAFDWAISRLRTKLTNLVVAWSKTNDPLNELKLVIRNAIPVGFIHEFWQYGEI